MARKLRLQYAGAIYHVMNRGNRREPIFTVITCSLTDPFTENALPAY
jgi:hypothetical protein